ncbi:MAG: quinolinate synthase NadA, partial [Muribaculaceae bacterium]|nr:quinolinate synthase NadA [Muribaculaceae bacterium]
VLAHPECKQALILLADVVGSTAALLNHAVKSDCKEFIVATESGILHEMQRQCPDKLFIPLPPDDSTCACNNCSFMKLNTLEKLRDCLLNEQPTVEVDPELAARARRPIDRMLSMS